MPCPLRSHVPDSLNQCVVLWISRLLVQDLYGFSVQVHILSFESDPVNPSHFIPVIVLNEQIEIVSIAEHRPFHRQILNLRGL